MANQIFNNSSEANKRISYAKVSGTLELPNLVEIQTDSYKSFINEGLKEVFENVYPIVGPNLKLYYKSLSFGNPKYDIDACRERGMTYSKPLKVVLELHNEETGEIRESEVFMGDMPWMTDVGTFIINGAERVIVSQIVRSPGVYLSKEMEKGKVSYHDDIIPARGTWLQFETDAKDIIYSRINRNKKVLVTTLFKALGLTSRNQIVNLFGFNKYIEETFNKDDTLADKECDPQLIHEALFEIYRRLKPGEPATEEGSKNHLIQHFFDPRRYDIARTGRYKFNKKLSIYNRLENHIIAEDLCDVNGEILYPAGTLITKEMILDMQEKKVFESGAHTITLNTNTELEESNTVQVIEVYTNEKKENKVKIVGVDLRIEKTSLTISDILAAFSYMMNLMEGIGSVDDIDHLSNRRIRTVGELLQNQFRAGHARMEKGIKEKMSTCDINTVTVAQLINIKPLTSAVKEFFSSSQLSQFMDQINPLAELANKRRISALGPSGLTRERANMEVRDVHFSHYGRICPIETPEGPNIGLINNLATYAKINEYGFLETPYRRVENLKVLNDSDYLSADEEFNKVIAQANIRLDQDGTILDDKVFARYRGDNIMVNKEDVDYVDVSPKQIVSVAAACVPFLENDDGQRALMGSNMQRQAVPLLKPSAPIVGTGMEARIAKDSGSAVVCKESGVVTYVDAKRIVVTTPSGEEMNYKLYSYARSNQGSSITQHPIVRVNQIVEKGQVIADGPAMENGELALGQNVTIAFMTWNGYNYEDAVIMSERLVKDDVYTSVHIEEYSIECRETKLGPEEITYDIPQVSASSKKYLDGHGVIVPGAEVKEGDILVGKVTPKGHEEPSPEEKLLIAILGEKSKTGKNTSLTVPHGGAGIVVDVKIFSRENGDELQPGVIEVVKVYIAQKRKISEGDKMAGRHGNKGVISRILPVEDMPFLPDGTPVDIMLNPLGVPSRMNIGQVLEVHLGMAAKKLGMKVATPVFDGVSNEELMQLIERAGMQKDAKTILYDGRTGEPFDERITVGVMYMIKLAHMVDDKLHARATGPYSLVTQQPLGGKAQNGGQRFGEMEVWALEAYGAAHILQEILTIKSDDMIGRSKTYEAIIKNLPFPKPGIPEAFRVLQKELQALAIDVRLLDKAGNEISIDNMAKESEEEVNRVHQELKQRSNGEETQQYDEEDLASFSEYKDIVDATMGVDDYEE
ncbi:MAG: DNA-directed RNA polymerase subunit beta [Bacilli bacterium]|nr:DNA-directed RNA polymerase subunit beta [Bacilli bacterium]